MICWVSGCRTNTVNPAANYGLFSVLLWVSEILLPITKALGKSSQGLGLLGRPAPGKAGFSYLTRISTLSGERSS